MKRKKKGEKRQSTLSVVKENAAVNKMANAARVLVCVLAVTVALSGVESFVFSGGAVGFEWSNDPHCGEGEDVKGESQLAEKNISVFFFIWDEHLGAVTRATKMPRFLAYPIRRLKNGQNAGLYGGWQTFCKRERD